MLESLNTLPAALDAHRLFRSSDLDDTRHKVAQVFKPHALVKTDDTPIDAEMCRLPFGGVALNLLSYGAAVDVDPACFERFMTFQVPLRGRARITLDDETFESSPSQAIIIEPQKHTRLSLTADCPQVILQVATPAIERWVEALTGRRLRGPVGFKPDVTMGSPAGMGLLGLVQYMVAHAAIMPSRTHGGGSHDQVARCVEELVVRHLLFAQPNAYSAMLGPASGAAPRYVRRAEEYMEAHVDAPLTLAELAVHADTSVRSLSAGFRRFRDCSPMEAFRRLRLDCAHAALRHEPGVTVACIARRHGFHHIGRFSAAYRERFGELPSETLADWRP